MVRFCLRVSHETYISLLAFFSGQESMDRKKGKQREKWSMNGAFTTSFWDRK
jgi:hypothetical protein